MRLDYQPDRVFTFHLSSYNKFHAISLSRPSTQGYHNPDLYFTVYDIALFHRTHITGFYF